MESTTKKMITEDLRSILVSMEVPAADALQNEMYSMDAKVSAKERRIEKLVSELEGLKGVLILIVRKIHATISEVNKGVH